MADTDTSATARDDREGYRRAADLSSLAASFARARSREVPDFAPAAFRRAVDAWLAVNETSGGEERGSAIERAMGALAEAEERARGAVDVLGGLSRLRHAAMLSERERFHAAKVLAEAEEHYRNAVEHAERGDADTARSEASAARRAFHEATLRGLELGPVTALESAITEAEVTTSKGALRAAKVEADDIRRALDETRRGNQDVSELRRQISIGGRRIGTGIDDLLDLPVLDPPEGDPTWPRKPERVDTIRVIERADDALTVRWLNPPTHADRNVLLRQREAGPWEPVAEFDELEGWTTHADTGLDAETLYCYRVQSENDRGVVVTAVDKRAGGYTRATTPIAVWRVQLRIRTADVTDAGTSDPVHARLTSPLRAFNPTGNRRWLDYGPRWEGGGLVGWRDDFARGLETTYDLDQSFVRELSDITMLTIAKEGSDAVGIAEITLLVNNIEVFNRVFGETAASCLWIDDGDGHEKQYTVWHHELRADPQWQAFVGANHLPPPRIPNADLVSRIESLVGHAIHGTEAYWGEFHSPAWVEATFLDAERLHVDIDLEADVPILQDPEIDIDFDLRFTISCNQAAQTATLRIESENVSANVDFDFLTELFGNILTAGQFGRIENWIAEEIAGGFQPIVETIRVETGLCPTVSVQPNGDVTFA